MKNRTENISVRYRPQHLTKSRINGTFEVTSTINTGTIISIKIPLA